MLGLALDESPLARVPPMLALRAASVGGVGAENPYPGLPAAGGVGRGGAPNIPGSTVYGLPRGEVGKGVVWALIVPADGLSWPRLAARCNEGDLGVSIRLGGRSLGAIY